MPGAALILTVVFAYIGKHLAYAVDGFMDTGIKTHAASIPPSIFLLWITPPHFFFFYIYMKLSGLCVCINILHFWCANTIKA